jgi:DNA-binding LacI/PurR family transcriptional regulator
MEERVVEHPRRPTIADVAERAGVSKTSVSFAFNSPNRLAPDTAERIRHVAASIGYRPHPVARMLSQRRTGAIGMLTPQALGVMFENPFFGAFTAGVSTAAEASGYALQLVSPLAGSLARAVGRATVDGIVAIGLPYQHPEVEEIRRAGIPMVTVDAAWPADMPTVDVEEERGSREAASYIASLGHRDILVISIDAPAANRDQAPETIMARRLRGYRQGLLDAGVSEPPTEVIAYTATIESGRAAFHDAWSNGHRPTAVLAMSDALAIGAMHAARTLDLRVPADVSIVGYDDIDVAQYVDPPLTTVRQPIRRKGEAAVELLLAVVHGEPPSDIHTTLATNLIVRASTAPPPQWARPVKGGEAEP